MNNHNQQAPAWLQDEEEEEKNDRKPLTNAPQSSSLGSVGSVEGGGK